MRIVVTGGAGFIGSHYVRSLCGGAYPAFAGAHLVVLDLLTYAGTRTNLTGCDVEFVHGDIRDADTVTRTLAGADVVVHFAAESHVDRSIAGAADFVSTNVVGTQVLLAGALAAGVDRFVHVSTDEVYGSIDEGSWPETDPLAPNSPYAASKAAAEQVVLAHHRTHGLDVRITRCSNNYGPYQFPEKVIPLFITNLLDGRKVPLYGDGLNVRDWLHVDDHCRAVQTVLDRGRAGEAYNVGGGTELTNRQLTDLLLRACGAGEDMVQYVPDRKGHDRRYSVDPGKIRRELGFVPRHRFADGLAATVRWYAENRSWWEPLLHRDGKRPLATMGAR